MDKWTLGPGGHWIDPQGYLITKNCGLAWFEDQPLCDDRTEPGGCFQHGFCLAYAQMCLERRHSTPMRTEETE